MILLYRNLLIFPIHLLKGRKSDIKDSLIFFLPAYNLENFMLICPHKKYIYVKN